MAPARAGGVTGTPADLADAYLAARAAVAGRLDRGEITRERARRDLDEAAAETNTKAQARHREATATPAAAPSTAASALVPPLDAHPLPPPIPVRPGAPRMASSAAANSSAWAL